MEGRGMTPFEKGYLPELTSDDPVVQDYVDIVGCEPSEALEIIAEATKSDEVWINDTYQVNIRRQETMAHLSIKRHDKEPARDWRDFQRIKNELVGEEFEAVELYPAESRLVDSANQYHLWVVMDPAFRWPFGFTERFVSNKPLTGGKQRPFAEVAAP
jgi:hypothetical protein